MATKDYLDPRWQKVRLRIMERDSFSCQSCGGKEKTLHVHHRSYEKGKRIWDTPDSDLITMCESCHEKVESMVAKARKYGDEILRMQESGISQESLFDVFFRVFICAAVHNQWAQKAIPVIECNIQLLVNEHLDSFHAMDAK